MDSGTGTSSEACADQQLTHQQAHAFETVQVESLDQSLVELQVLETACGRAFPHRGEQSGETVGDHADARRAMCRRRREEA